MKTVVVEPAGPVLGEMSPPGDKSISHRALLLGAIAEGDTVIEGLAPGKDVQSTLDCLSMLGVRVRRRGAGLVVRGQGPAGLLEPEQVLDAGNSGTTMRLLAGVLAGRPFYAVLNGDGSLRRRPMDRIIEPLTQMGATVLGRGGGRFPPLAIRGSRLKPIRHTSAVPSAQVKSAVLLAGLFAAGETCVVEPAKSRDHTERMLPLFGADTVVNGLAVGVRGPAPLRAAHLRVPGDISSAAFFLVAATLLPGSRLLLRNVGVNPTRTGAIRVLRAMGAHLRVLNPREIDGEPVADLEVCSARLAGVTIEGADLPAMLDEIPVLAVAATQARGTTVIKGAAELRVKETDRLRATARNLAAMGADIIEAGDGLEIRGPARLRGARIRGEGDHRLIMAGTVAALVADGPSVIEDADAAAVSYPGFFADLRALVREGGVRP